MIIALPNKGRLSEPSIEILREAGIKIDYENRRLIAPTNKEGISVLFARARDIPEYVHKKRRTGWYHRYRFSGRNGC